MMDVFTDGDDKAWEKEMAEYARWKRRKENNEMLGGCFTLLLIPALIIMALIFPN